MCSNKNIQLSFKKQIKQEVINTDMSLNIFYTQLILRKNLLVLYIAQEKWI